MKQIYTLILGYIPEQYRRYVPLVLVIMFLLLLVFPSLFGGNGTVIRDAIATELFSVTPTP